MENQAGDNSNNSSTGNRFARMERINSTMSARILLVLGATLVLHLLTHIIHGLPHVGIPVNLRPALLAGVVLFVYVLPLVGITSILLGADQIGVLTFTTGMVGSFLQSNLLHFLLSNPDNIRALGAGPWQDVFAGTAVMIAVVDGFGIILGVYAWRELGEDGFTALP